MHSNIFIHSTTRSATSFKLYSCNFGYRLQKLQDSLNLTDVDGSRAYLLEREQYGRDEKFWLIPADLMLVVGLGRLRPDACLRKLTGSANEMAGNINDCG